MFEGFGEVYADLWTRGAPVDTDDRAGSEDFQRDQREGGSAY